MPFLLRWLLPSHSSTSAPVRQSPKRRRRKNDPPGDDTTYTSKSRSNNNSNNIDAIVEVTTLSNQEVRSDNTTTSTTTFYHHVDSRNYRTHQRHYHGRRRRRHGDTGNSPRLIRLPNQNLMIGVLMILIVYVSVQNFGMLKTYDGIYSNMNGINLPQGNDNTPNSFDTTIITIAGGTRNKSSTLIADKNDDDDDDDNNNNRVQDYVATSKESNPIIKTHDRNSSKAAASVVETKLHPHSTTSSTTTLQNNNNSNQSLSMYQIALLKDLPHPEMVCGSKSTSTTTTTRTSTSAGEQEVVCCVLWTTNIDEWWTHHPDWRISYSNQNTTHQCFTKYDKPEQAMLIRQLYKVQWGVSGGDNSPNDKTYDDATDIYERTELPSSSRHCGPNLYQNYQILSGVGATVPITLGGLYEAFRRRRPYQLAKRSSRQGSSGNHWLYVSEYKEQWSWCPTRDLRCFILPVSNCISINGDRGGKNDCPECRIHFSSNHPQKQQEDLDDTTANLITQYGLRFKHELRHQIQLTSDKFFHKLGDRPKDSLNNCTVMHVRRGDKAISLPGFARYAGLLEYIQRGNISPKDPILLLTDDVSTIVEAQRYYSDYNWYYFDIPRKDMTKPKPNRDPRSPAGWEGHVVNDRYSGVDPGIEFAAIFAEVLVGATYCNKLVHGKTHFTEVIQIAYAMLGKGRQPQLLKLKTEITEDEAKRYDNISRTEIARVYIDQIYAEAEQAMKERTAKKNV